MGFIYKITNNINNKLYIGQTKRKSVQPRWKEHRNHINEKRMPIHRAFKKYGINNFSFEIIEQCENNLLNEREIYWVSYYNASNPKYGYNATPGGKQSAFCCYKKVNQYTLDGELIKTWNSQAEIEQELGYRQSTLSNCLIGNRKTAFKYQWRFANDNRPVEPINYRCSKKVYQYDLDGNFIKEFKMIKDAELETSGNPNRSNIVMCCLGKHISTHGYQWSYEKHNNIGSAKSKYKQGAINYDF